MSQAATPATVTYSLDNMPILNRTAEGIRARMGQYVDYMTLGGKKATRVLISRDQRTTLFKAVNGALMDGTPPCGGLTFRGLPVCVLGEEGADETP